MRRGPGRARERGFSLLEVIVGMTMLTGALLGLAAAASTGIRQTTRAHDDSQYWADAQQVMDSLFAVGCSGVADGSTTVRGRFIAWSVTGGCAPPPRKVLLRVNRYGYQTQMPTSSTDKRWKVVTDTIVFYLANQAITLP